MLQVRDAVREAFRTQVSDGEDRHIVEARNHLNRTYDFLFLAMVASTLRGT